MANFVQEAADKFCYVYSSELDVPFKIKMSVSKYCDINIAFVYKYAEALLKGREKGVTSRPSWKIPRYSFQASTKANTLICTLCVRYTPTGVRSVSQQEQRTRHSQHDGTGTNGWRFLCATKTCLGTPFLVSPFTTFCPPERRHQSEEPPYRYLGSMDVFEEVSVTSECGMVSMPTAAS